MNEDIKSAAKKAGVPLFRIGYSMGISESALSRKLRGQLNDKEKEAIYLAIKHAAVRGRYGFDDINYHLYTRNNKLHYMLAKRRMKARNYRSVRALTARQYTTSTPANVPR